MRRLAPLGLFALLAALFFGRALFGGTVLLPLDLLALYPPWRAHAAELGVGIPNNHLIADTILQNYSWKALAASAFAAGQLPLWNPYILAGQPFLAAGQNGSLYPPGVLFFLLSGGQAYGWFAALHFTLAGGLTYWLVRVLGGSRFGGLVGGVCFAFCGYLVVSVLWPMVVSTAVWLPGLLAIVELLVRAVTGPVARAGRRVVPLILGGAAIVTLQFLAGHLEMSLYLLITAGLYAAARLVAAVVTGPPRPPAEPGKLATPDRRILRVLVAGCGLIGLVGLGTLGAAIQLVPFVEAISANVRGGQVGYDDVRSYALPRQQLLALLQPDVFGNPSHHAVFDLFEARQRPLDRPIELGGDAHWGTEWGPKNYVEGTVYLGLLPLLLAIAALAFRRDGPTWTLAGLATVCLLLAFGTPLYALLFFGLPGVNQLHTPFRWVYPASLCLAVLAGLGATSLEVRPAGCRRAPAVAAVGLIPGGLGLVGAALAWALRESLIAPAEQALRRTRPLAESFLDPRAFISYEWAGGLGLALLLLAGGLRPLALALLIGDLFSFGIGFNTTADPGLLRYVPPEIRAIRADGGLFRIATLGEDDTLPANTGMLFGLQDLRGYDTIILRDYVGYLELIEPQRGLLYSKVHKLLDPRSLESPLLDLLNVKYVLTSLRLESPGWRLLVDGPTRVYQNIRVLPRALLVERGASAADPSDALRLLARPELNPRDEVVLEDEPLPLAGPAVRTPGQGFEGPVGPPPQVVRYEPNRIVVEATALRPAYLLLADLYFPGWTVRVDGAEQRLLRADRIFRAVRLAPGQHEVVFEYRPFTVRIGGLLSLAALVLAGLTLGGWAYGRLELNRRLGQGPAGRVLKNSLFPLTTGLLNKGLDFAFAIVYLRLLGPAGAGAYTFVVVLFGYFDILVNFGLGTLLTREVARDRAETDRMFGNTLLLRLALASVALLAAVALAGPLGPALGTDGPIGLALVLLTLGMLPGALASTASALFMAHERMEVPAAVTVAATLMRIGLGTAALLAGWGIVGLAGVSLAVNLFNAAALGGLMVGLLGRPRVRPELRLALGLVAISWPLMLNNFLNSLFFRIDALLLKPLAGEAALGYYGTAYKFLDGLQIIPSTFVLALFPLLARQAAEHRAGLARAYGLGLKVLLVLALPISVGTTLLAEPIVGLFAGPAYLPEAAFALQVLIWFLPFSFVNGLTQYVLIAVNRQRWITVSFFVGALANAGLNLLLIPQFGYLAAAAVTVVSEWVLFVPFWLAVRRELPPVDLPALAWRPLVAAAIMGLAVFMARELNPWAAIPVGALVYGLALVSLRVATRAELEALRGQR